MAQATSLDDPNKRFADEQAINDQITSQSADPLNTQNRGPGKIDSAMGANSRNPDIDPDNLTDADRQTKDLYVHQEYVNNAMKEECEKNKDLEQACSGRDMGNGMVNALAKAYGMIIGMGGLGGDLKMRQPEAEAPTEGGAGSGTGAQAQGSGSGTQEKKEDRHDYCKYGAMVTEAVATFQQTQSNEALIDGDQAKAETAQAAQLYKAARSHRDRAKTAQIQTVGWGATAACYGVMLATGAALDWNLGIKLGGSTILAIFFGKEIETHNDAADKIEAIAGRLPGRGDCNPITERDCYCSQKSTMNDVRYCAPYLQERQLAAGSIQTTCVTKTLQQDPKCSCVATNTCFDQEFLAGVDLSRLPPSFTKNVAEPIGRLSRGELTSGAVAAARTGNGAIRKLLRDTADKNSDKNPRLNKSQKAIASALTSEGIPARIAAGLAAAPISDAALAKAKQNFAGNGKVDLYNGRSRKSGNNVWGFGAKNNRRRAFKKKSKKNPFGKIGKDRGPTGKVISFAEKAAAKAQINQDPNRPIFDIISRRYQLSAFERLEIK